MATQLSIVNRVLRRLRESQITASTNSDYAALVAEFVAIAHRDVIDAHDWEVLKHRVRIDLIPAQTIYEVTRTVASGGNARNTDPRVCKMDSELLFDAGDPQVWVYQSDSDTAPIPMTYCSPEGLRDLQSQNVGQTNPTPYWFTYYPYIVGGIPRLVVEVWPTPTVTRVVHTMWITSPDELLADGTTDNTTIVIPDRPIMELALMYALNERGEELGEPGSLAVARFKDALDFAIERDVRDAGRAGRYDWMQG